jgi:pimeloyl-ACP methyl ester carboxylesterase
VLAVILQPVLQETVTTPDGRTLAVEIAGDPQGKPVLVHMGTPNSRHLYGPNVADAAARGLRLICYDRPGYGGSTPMPGRTIADCAADVRTICEFLGVERLGVWGISGGGPHALACAALLGDVVVGVASLASLAPYGAEGLDYFAGMGTENVEDIKLSLADPAAGRAKLEQDRLEYLEARPDDLREAIASLLTPTDRAVLEGPLTEHLVRAAHDGLAPGSDGWAEDSDAFFAPWGFDLASIEVPVLLMHGREDMFVPFAHGEWLSGHIPGVQARLLDADGHLTLMTKGVEDVHAWLAARL